MVNEMGVFEVLCYLLGDGQFLADYQFFEMSPEIWESNQIYRGLN